MTAERYKIREDLGELENELQISTHNASAEKRKFLTVKHFFEDIFKERDEYAKIFQKKVENMLSDVLSGVADSEDIKPQLETIVQRLLKMESEKLVAFESREKAEFHVLKQDKAEFHAQRKVEAKLKTEREEEESTRRGGKNKKKRQKEDTAAGSRRPTSSSSSSRGIRNPNSNSEAAGESNDDDDDFHVDESTSKSPYPRYDQFKKPAAASSSAAAGFNYSTQATIKLDSPPEHPPPKKPLIPHNPFALKQAQQPVPLSDNSIGSGTTATSGSSSLVWGHPKQDDNDDNQVVPPRRPNIFPVAPTPTIRLLNFSSSSSSWNPPRHTTTSSNIRKSTAQEETLKIGDDNPGYLASSVREPPAGNSPAVPNSQPGSSTFSPTSNEETYTDDDDEQAMVIEKLRNVCETLERILAAVQKSQLTNTRRGRATTPSSETVSSKGRPPQRHNENPKPGSSSSSGGRQRKSSRAPNFTDEEIAVLQQFRKRWATMTEDARRRSAKAKQIWSYYNKRMTQPIQQERTPTSLIEKLKKLPVLEESDSDDEDDDDANSDEVDDDEEDEVEEEDEDHDDE